MLKRSWAALAFVLACAVSGVAQEQPAFSIPFRELESYKKAGREWRNIVVDQKIKRDDLVRLARELHAAYPETPFRIFTDDEKFREFMQHDLRRPDPAYAYPEEWAERHYVADINGIWRRGGHRWVLYPAGPRGRKFVPQGETAIAEL